MELVRRHWLLSTQMEQRFASFHQRYNVRLAIDARSQAAASAARGIQHHHHQTILQGRSTFARKDFRSVVLSSLLQVYREQTSVRIQREQAAVGEILHRAVNRSTDPAPAAPTDDRVLSPVIPAMIARALTRIERIENVVTEPARRQFVLRPAPPALPASFEATAQTGFLTPRWIPQQATTVAPPAQEMSSADVERLTDRLMRNIDRRLVASRERNGRT